MSVYKYLKNIFKSFIIKALPSYFKSKSFKELRKFSWQKAGKSNFELEFLLLPFLVKPNMVFFDVGANIGQYTDTVSRLTNPSGIYIFEPNKNLYWRLQKLFRTCKVFNLALSNNSGFVEMKIPIQSGLLIDTRGSLEQLHYDGELLAETIETITLDNFVEKHGLSQLDLIKIDVEGHELKVLQGGARTFKRLNPIVIVEIDIFHYKNGTSEIFTYIKDIGYSVFYLDNADFQIKPLPPESNIEFLQNEIDRGMNRKYINNFILIHHQHNPENWQKNIQIKINEQLKSVNLK